MELRRGGSLRISPVKNHLESINRRVRVNLLISRFYNENDLSNVMNQTRRGLTVPRFSLVYHTFIAVNS